MINARVLYYGLVAIYLLGVVVQFFLAGLGAFDATDTYDAHVALGFILAIGSLVLLALAIVGRLPRLIVLLTLVLVVLNVVQIVLARLDEDVPELAALHPVNALAIFLLAGALVQRSRGYLASKMAA